jgi:hypothetical protein
MPKDQLSLSNQLMNRRFVPFLAGLPLVALFVIIGLTAKHSSHAAVTYPTTPPAQICGNSSVLGNGPTSAPAGAITVPAGDNSGINWGQAGKTFWFASGTHTLGTGQFGAIDPADNATLIGAPGAVIDGQGKNSYAVVGKVTGVTVKYLTFKNFGQGSSATTPSSDDNNEGVINHDAGHNWTIQYITAQYNAGAAVFIGSGDTVSDNCLDHNAQYGFSAYEDAGVSNVTLNHNEVSWNDTYNWEAKIDGCGCTGGGKFWATNGATVTNNYVHDNYSVGIWADTNNTGFNFDGNYISNNHDEGIIYEISYNFRIANNNFVSNAIPGGISDTGFPHSAIYISESGSDSRAGSTYATESDITGNGFTNNWGGVILYENPNRYCSSSANSSSGDCTIVNPSVANITSCANAGNLAKTPYIDDCRWKTKNVKVTGNTFSATPSQISASCTQANSCGYNGLFSQYGTYAPYTAWMVTTNISNNQNNTFAGNTYLGTWRFNGYDLGEDVTFAQWQAGFNDSDGSGVHVVAQDAGSTMNSTASPTIPPTTTPAPTTSPTPAPTSSPGLVVGDLNSDGTVNIFDLSIMLSKWGTTDAVADLNHDGTVNIFDLSTLLTHWGQSGAGSTPTPSSTPAPSATPAPTSTPGGITFNSCTSPSYIIPMSSSDPQTGQTFGNFYVTNDNWNSGSGSAQTMNICNYNNWYATATEPNTTSVKTYPNVHQDFINWGTNAMPAISSYNTITSTYAETSPHTGIYEWAYDIWLNGVADNNSTEVMIWNDNYNQAPAGTKRGTFASGGTTYDVYSESTNCAPPNGCYIAFVPQANTTSGTVDIKAFFSYLMNTVHYIPTNSTIGQIDYGVEICSTNNVSTKFTLNNFSLTAQ